MSPSREGGAGLETAASAAVRLVLPNGLTIILKENHANPTVALHGVVKAGAIFDPPGKSGLGMFTGGMLDQGTRTRTAFEQASAIENLGASLRFEGGSETVTLHGTMLSEDLEEVLAELADALRNPVFPPDEIEKIRGELLNEYRIAENSTASVAARRANGLLFPPGHPYHRHSGGDEEGIRSITREDLIAHHRAHYGADSTVIVLVGDVTPDGVRSIADRAFATWSKRPKAIPFEVPAVPELARSRRLVVTRPGKSQADVVYAIPGVARTAPDYDAVMMMNYVLGGGSLSSRLMDQIRDRQGLVYGVYSGLMAGIGAGPLQIRAGTNPDNVDRCAEAILEEVRRLHDEGPTDEEMEEAKGYLTGVFPVRLETNAGVAGQLLSAELYGLGLDYIDRYPSIIRSVTTARAREAAREHLDPDRYVLVFAGPLDPAGLGDVEPDA
jgi:zinc protease